MEKPIGITTGPDVPLWLTAISGKGEDIERIYHYREHNCWLPERSHVWKVFC